MTRHLILLLYMLLLAASPCAAQAGGGGDSLAAEQLMADEGVEAPAGAEAWLHPAGMHQQLKQRFVDGGPLFMSLVALVLVVGLALCIERIIYLTLSQVDHRRLLADVDQRVQAADVEGAKELCRATRGPVASLCYQGLAHLSEPPESLQRSLENCGSLLAARLERGCSWISFCITVAPSLGFLGTVVGMVIAFDQIEQAGDIGPTIVAGGMKVALITTIFGIITALVLQLFHSYVLSRIDGLAEQMEESAIALMDIAAAAPEDGKPKQQPQAP